MDDIEQIILRCRETRGVEFKESQPWDVLDTKIIRTALGMANIRDGGRIVVGISERSGRIDRTGMSPEALSTYALDTLRAQVNRYAQPHVSLDLEPHELGGQAFLVITVSEFEDLPIICRRDRTGNPGLRRGALYTRTLNAETVEVQDPDYLREIVNLATNRRVAEFRGRLRLAGIESDVTPLDSAAKQRFDEEVQEL